MNDERTQFAQQAAKWVKDITTEVTISGQPYQMSALRLVEQMLGDDDPEDNNTLPGSTRRLLDSLTESQLHDLAELLWLHSREYIARTWEAAYCREHPDVDLEDITAVPNPHADFGYDRDIIFNSASQSKCSHSNCGRTIVPHRLGWTHRAPFGTESRSCRSASFDFPRPGDEETKNEWNNWPRALIRQYARPPRNQKQENRT